MDGQPQIQGRVGGGELGGVFQQVVNDLGDKVVDALHHHRLLRDVRLYVQLPVGDLLLHGQQRQTHTLAQVEVLFFHLLRLDLRDIQHPAHQTAEPTALVGDNLQVLAFFFRRDGAVQNTVGVAGDGGHGGL